MRNHGYSKHKLYQVWVNMKARCYDPNNNRSERYSGRGITVCKEWLNSAVFINWALMVGWEDGLQIDRKDNDGNYEPGNCRFVTSRENAINKGMRSDNKSGYIGVSWSKRSKKWLSVIKVDGKQKYLGLFSSPRMAACRRDVEAMMIGYRTNF